MACAADNQENNRDQDGREQGADIAAQPLLGAPVDVHATAPLAPPLQLREQLKLVLGCFSAAVGAFGHILSYQIATLLAAHFCLGIQLHSPLSTPRLLGTSHFAVRRSIPPSRPAKSVRSRREDAAGYSGNEL